MTLTAATQGVWVCECLNTDLVGQSLRGGVTDATAVRDAHHFSAEL